MWGIPNFVRRIVAVRAVDSPACSRSALRRSAAGCALAGSAASTTKASAAQAIAFRNPTARESTVPVTRGARVAAA